MMSCVAPGKEWNPRGPDMLVSLNKIMDLNLDSMPGNGQNKPGVDWLARIIEYIIAFAIVGLLYLVASTTSC